MASVVPFSHSPATGCATGREVGVIGQAVPAGRSYAWTRPLASEATGTSLGPSLCAQAGQMYRPSPQTACEEAKTILRTVQGVRSRTIISKSSAVAVGVDQLAEFGRAVLIGGKMENVVLAL